MSDDSMIDDMIAGDPELMESFIDESKKCLDTAVKDLSDIRDNLGSIDQERIESGFRAVHSVKSSAGFLGLGNVMELALKMEDVLGRFRGNPGLIDLNKIEILLEGVELLTSMLADPKGSKDIDTGVLLNKLSDQV